MLAAMVGLFVLIAVVRLPIVAMPPYWDHAIGLWTEANFLAETDFDYHRLWTEEKPIWEGGARCYLTSALPSLLAISMRVLPTPAATLVAYHLATFAAAAACLVLLYDVVASRAGPAAGLLAALATGTNPLFSTQIDMLGMEIPLALCALLALWFALREQLVAAALSSLAAFLMKASGVVITAALLLYVAGVLLGGRSPNREVRRRSIVAIVLLTFFLALEVAAVLAAGHVASQLVASHRHRAPGLSMMLYWSPDVLLLLLLTAGGFAWGLWRGLSSEARTCDRAQRPREVRRLLRSVLDCWPLEVLCVLMIAGTLAAIQRVILLPRYLVLIVPLVVACAVLFVFRASRTSRLPVALGTLWIAFNLCNWNGDLLPDQAWVIETAFDVDNGLDYARTGAFLERSHEYLADHQANQAAVRRLVAEHRAETILAGTPWLHFLAFPRLGYVPEPLGGYAANPFTDFVDCFPPATPTIIDQLPRRPLILYVGNTFSRLANTFELPPPAQHDTVVFHDHRPSPLMIYRKGWPVGADDQQSRAVWYARRMWPHALVEQRALRQADLLARHGYRRAAIAQLQTALEGRPSHTALRLALVRLLLDDGQTYRAVAAAALDARRPATTTLAQSGSHTSRANEADGPAPIDHEGADERPAIAHVGPSSTVGGQRNGATTAAQTARGAASPGGQAAENNRLDRALVRLRAGEVRRAADEFLQAAREQPDRALARFAAGMVHFHRHELPAALAHFEAAAALEPDRAILWESIGRVALQQGRFEAAIAALQRATALPCDAEAHYLLGLALARQHRFAEAAAQFRRALALRPEFAAPRQKLARLPTNRHRPRP